MASSKDHTTVSGRFDESILRDLQEIGWSRDDMNTWMDQILADMKGALERIHFALEAKKTNALRDASHALKGLAASVGATQLITTCSECLCILERGGTLAYNRVLALDALVAEVQGHLPSLVAKLMS